MNDQQLLKEAAPESSVGQTAPTSDNASVLIDVKAVSKILNCSTRQVYRLADAGKMPQKIKLGSLVRWCRPVIDAWIAGGCNPVRSAAAKGARK
jgi:predicted DNA-binding transcriptional regulator AlpA